MKKLKMIICYSKFVAEVISVKKDKDNKIIEGNPDKIKFVTDVWKFTKILKNKS